MFRISILAFRGAIPLGNLWWIKVPESVRLRIYNFNIIFGFRVKCVSLRRDAVSV